MKKLITAVAAMMFVLAFVTAFADEMPSIEVGAILNIEAPGHVTMPKRFRGDLFYEPADVLPVPSSTARKDFGGPLISEKLVDVGTALYQSAFETKLLEPSITGVAAGGVAREDDETTRIWDNLMVPTKRL